MKKENFYWSFVIFNSVSLKCRKSLIRLSATYYLNLNRYTIQEKGNFKFNFCVLLQ